MTGVEPLPRGAIDVLEASRMREKAQTLFYRALAAHAAAAHDQAATDRLNDLHADEQHHLSRLTARLLELGHSPRDLAGGSTPERALAGWEEEARAREVEEVRWYEEVSGLELDPETRAVIVEILESERQQARHLGGKWMPA